MISHGLARMENPIVVIAGQTVHQDLELQTGATVVVHARGPHDPQALYADLFHGPQRASTSAELDAIEAKVDRDSKRFLFFGLWTSAPDTASFSRVIDGDYTICVAQRTPPPNAPVACQQREVRNSQSQELSLDLP